MSAYQTTGAQYSSKQDEAQGLSLTGVNAAVVRLTAVEVTVRMLHGETPSDAMQSGFNDVQQEYLDTAQLPGAASEDRATAANLIENLPVLSSSISIVSRKNASVVSELEDFILALERDAVADGKSRGGIINVPTTDDCFGIYMSFIDADLPIFPVLFDPLSRDNRPAASCLYFDSSVDLAAFMGQLMSKLSNVHFNSVYPLEVLTLQPAGSAGLDSEHPVGCDDLIEALGWPRPQAVPQEDEHSAEESDGAERSEGEAEKASLNDEEIVPVTPVKEKEGTPMQLDTPATVAASSPDEEQEQQGSTRGKAFRVEGVSGDMDLPAEELPSEELPEFSLLPPEPVIEGNEDNQFCGFCGFDWRRELLPLHQRFFGKEQQ
ncbi:hypothetical protein FOZ63_027116 [Perkinsus olseni]|uniref:Uncharacterized protein n=1 Tax=Perkinsus olseni TaxID=32597 RepID=A0A7J6R5T1_PEROL|nr:hypothetical protein FOZ63_027116 [Perkinsus olseni]KAF4746382.1 hypothetical protein FOZ62_018936 [Perkinsus olseni]